MLPDRGNSIFCDSAVMPRRRSVCPMLRPALHHRRVVSLLTCLVLVTVGCSGDGGDPVGSGASAHQVDDDAKWLFALLAERATAVGDDGGYVVAISYTHDVISFTDRPERIARRFVPAALVAAWSDLFAGEAPNGVIAGRTPDGAEIDVVVELTDAVLVGPDALEFQARPIGDDADSELPPELSDVSLFIDDATIPDSLVYSSTFVPFDVSF